MKRAGFSVAEGIPNAGTIPFCGVYLFRLLWIFVWLLPALHVVGQDIPVQESLYQLEYRLDLPAKAFATDKLQHIYYITNGNELVKLGPEGAEQFRFINKTLGEPAYLDATNPFNLLLFFPDYQNVLILDRTLNLAGQLNLFQLGLFQIHAIGAAGDGNLWVYDEVNFRLKKIGQDGEVVLQSADLSLELQKNIRPNFLLERGQLVYLNDPETGILLFDIFGKYLKTLPILGLESFQVIGDRLYYCADGQCWSFHLKALVQQAIPLPEGVSAESDIRMEKNRLYALQEQVLSVYQLINR